MNQVVLITRNIIVLPAETMTIDVGRAESIAAVNRSLKSKKIYIASQKDPQHPSFGEILPVGTLCELISTSKSPDGEGIVVEVKGIKRVTYSNFKLVKPNKSTTQETTATQDGTYWTADIEPFNTEINPETVRHFQSKLKVLLSLANIDIDIMETKVGAKDKDTTTSSTNGRISATNAEVVLDHIARYSKLTASQRYAFHSIPNLKERVNKLMAILEANNPTAPKLIDQEITKKVNDKMNKSVREHFLREKYQEIRNELGQLNPNENETNAYRKRVLENPYPEHIKKRIIAELDKMEGSHPQENAINRQYVEWLLDIPWWQVSKDNSNIKKVESSLNKSHYGLDKPKERILEYLSVRLRSPQSKAPIMCLVGPPGVGKTTLAQSIAEAIGKKFCKVNLGGISDESEIRGHRKTYLGAMPGRIIKAMKNAETINPLFLLDEIDKMDKSYHGDPSSAMLEVLDPSLNKKFSDNYIEEPYDLSQVMFVATANYVEQIPAPLYDRLEIIEITSYTEYEKFEIAKRHLIARVFEDAKLSNEELKFTDEALLYIIRRYTREAGVRQLERLIQTIARKFIVQQQKGGLKNEVIGVKEVIKYLKKEIFNNNEIDKESTPGVVNGMAYTTTGGDLLPIEVTTFKGKGNIHITGNLKETMRESVQVAVGFVKANAASYGVSNVDFSKIDIHVHVPSGGIPKDGPSAGVTITTALISALSSRPVSNKIAMTGEITLRGKVGIIGGVKEKVISAVRGGVKEIFIPTEDERYLDDVPKEILAKTKIYLVRTYNDIYSKIFKLN